ncbi:MAG: periplasmic heavy metal sensor [Pseudomonadota bacterium]
MAEAEMTPAPKSPLWMRVLLVASLGLNLLIVGMVVGTIASGGGPGKGRDALRDAGGSPFVRALEPADRRGVMRGMIAERRALRESRETLRARFDALLAALRAENFDAAAVEQLLEDQRRALQARNTVGETVILNHLSEMSLDQRRAYADRLEAEIRPRQRP